MSERFIHNCFLRGYEGLDAYATHQPVLIHTLSTIITGDVLEFGMGWHSTALMHYICGAQGRNLLSIETDEGRYKRFIDFRNDRHQLRLCEQKPFYDGTHWIFSKRFTVAFIDAAPAEIRQPVIERINADYIVIHDTELPEVYNYDFSMFRHVINFSPITPATSILSNLPEIDLRLTRI